jgi:hypothetical protein
LGHAYQLTHTIGACEFDGDALVLCGPVLDPGFEQGKEHVRFAAELRIHHAAGEPGIIGDRLQTGAGIPTRQEHPPRGGKDELTITRDLLGTPKP